MAQYIKGNNNKNGFYYEMADGTYGWIYGLSKAEWNRMEREHGCFVRYERAQKRSHTESKNRC